MKHTPYILSILVFLLVACGGTGSPPSGNGGRPAPEFDLPNALGGDVALQDFAGQPVLLFFHMAVG